VGFWIEVKKSVWRLLSAVQGGQRFNCNACGNPSGSRDDPSKDKCVMFKTTINAAGEFQIRESEMIAEHLPEMIRTTGRQDRWQQDWLVDRTTAVRRERILMCSMGLASCLKLSYG
jgi:hypothetical protein